ncbi:TonB-dependent receptor (plasmid) [Pseudomonas silvicola]|nr:TonB-dependent receptor [Pseudomonas silvicola]
MMSFARSLLIPPRVFHLADPLSLIIGARYTEWSTNGSSGDMMTQHNTTPYAGLVYDINDTWSAYASYTSIFQPQTYRNSSGHYLSPVTGKSYETGLKSTAWYDGRLTATFAVFRIQQRKCRDSRGWRLR